MPDTLESVKSLARNYRTWALSNAIEKPDMAKRQSDYAATLEAASLEIEDARIRLRSVSNALGDLSDLPPEVLAELSVSKLDDLEQQMRDIVASGEDVGLDTVIVELYRRHKVIQPRKFIMNKLYRMAQKGLLNAVEGKKGVYAIPASKVKSQSFSVFDSDLDDDVPF
ncbi:MAG: hypothetical protein AABY88_09085 [Pseudomonadota bacterium]